LPVLASFFGAAAGALPLAAFWPLGAPFFGLASVFEEAFPGATVEPCSATAAVFSVVRTETAPAASSFCDGD
jgi:hypothetical protein